LLFLIFLILIGLPFFILELSFGRHAQSGLISAFQKLNKNNKNTYISFAWLGILCSLLIAGWYSVIAGWSLQYVWFSLQNSFANQNIQDISQTFDTFRQNAPLNILWQVVFIYLTVYIIKKGISEGIEKYSKILTSLLFVVILFLFLYSLTLSGFGQALEYILFFRFEDFTATTIIKALGLALFSLSLGQGIMATYGSYMKESEDIPKTAAIITLTIVFIGVLVSLMIFPMVFTFGLAPNEGEGLIFKTLPYVFSQLPGSRLISTLFFSLLGFAAITSSVGQFEVIVATFTDTYKWTRAQAAYFTGFIALLIGLPAAAAYSGYLNFCYDLTDWMLIIFAFGLSILWAWRMPLNLIKSAFESGSNYKNLFGTWLFLCRYLVPSALLVICVQKLVS